MRAAFFLNGFLLASWVVNIPAIEERAGISHAVLGSLLLLLGLGSFVSMQVGGWAVDRVGSRSMTIAGATFLGFSTVLVGAVDGPVVLAAVILMLGIGNGVLDVAMNSSAADLERVSGRPLMSGFHAFFSIGGAAGAAYGAIAHGVGLALTTLLAVAAGFGLVLGALTLPHLVRPDVCDHTSDDEAVVSAGSSEPSSDRTRTRVVGLALLAFILMMAEGVAADWSALHAREHLAATDAWAASAYASFAVAMTVGRLVADRVSGAIGGARVVRYGASAAALGLLMVVLAPSLPLALVGWLVFGLGLSGSVPQIFSAVGRLSPASRGVLMSRVVGAGYLGLLAGPAAVGWVAEGTSLGVALLTPALLCVVAAGSAGVLAERRRRPAVSSLARMLVPIRETGGWVAVSGQIGADQRGSVLRGVGPQTTQALANLTEKLAEHSLALDDVVKVNVYLTAMDLYDDMNAAYVDVFDGHQLPARTAVAVLGLPRGASVEIEAWAHRA